MGKLYVFWVLKIYCMGREGKDGRTGQRDGSMEGETARKTSLLLGDLSRGPKEMKKEENGTSFMPLHTCSHLSDYQLQIAPLCFPKDLI